MQGGFTDFAGYSISTFLWDGARIAVEITALAMAIGLVLGLVLAMMRLSRLAVLRSFAWIYIWVMRGTPQLLQLVLIFDALPLLGVKFDSFTTAVIGFSLNQAAFSAEGIRGAVSSVGRNQAVAAASLGMGPLLTLRRIILPQAMPGLLPGIANDTINMIKLTSIASVIFVNELTFRSLQIVGQNFKFFTVFAAAGLIYLLLTSAISLLQVWLERRFDIHRDRSQNVGAFERFLGFGFRHAPPGDAPGQRSTLAPPDAALKSTSSGSSDFLRSLTASLPSEVSAGNAIVCTNVHKNHMATGPSSTGSISRSGTERWWSCLGRAAPENPRCCG
jgi:polar amino acid transport system permease protein